MKRSIQYKDKQDKLEPHQIFSTNNLPKSKSSLSTAARPMQKVVSFRCVSRRSGNSTNATSGPIVTEVDYSRQTFIAPLKQKAFEFEELKSKTFESDETNVNSDAEKAKLISDHSNLCSLGSEALECNSRKLDKLDTKDGKFEVSNNNDDNINNGDGDGDGDDNCDKDDNCDEDDLDVERKVNTGITNSKRDHTEIIQLKFTSREENESNSNAIPINNDIVDPNMKLTLTQFETNATASRSIVEYSASKATNKESHGENNGALLSPHNFPREFHPLKKTFSEKDNLNDLSDKGEKCCKFAGLGKMANIMTFDPNEVKNYQNTKDNNNIVKNAPSTTSWIRDNLDDTLDDSEMTRETLKMSKESQSVKYNSTRHYEESEVIFWTYTSSDHRRLTTFNNKMFDEGRPVPELSFPIPSASIRVHSPNKSKKGIISTGYQRANNSPPRTTYNKTPENDSVITGSSAHKEFDLNAHVEDSLFFDQLDRGPIFFSPLKNNFPNSPSKLCKENTSNISESTSPSGNKFDQDSDRLYRFAWLDSSDSGDTPVDIFQTSPTDLTSTDPCSVEKKNKYQKTPKRRSSLRTNLLKRLSHEYERVPQPMKETQSPDVSPLPSKFMDKTCLINNQEQTSRETCPDSIEINKEALFITERENSIVNGQENTLVNEEEKRIANDQENTLGNMQENGLINKQEISNVKDKFFTNNQEKEFVTDQENSFINEHGDFQHDVTRGNKEDMLKSPNDDLDLGKLQINSSTSTIFTQPASSAAIYPLKESDRDNGMHQFSIIDNDKVNEIENEETGACSRLLSFDNDDKDANENDNSELNYIVRAFSQSPLTYLFPICSPSID